MPAIRSRTLKSSLSAVAIIVIALVTYVQRTPAPARRPEGGDERGESLVRAIEEQSNHVQVQGQGTVVRVLPDDNEGSRHQRFVIQIDSGQTVLIAHNIDLAARIPQLRESDLVSFNGEYEWNSQGGVIHWTHRDPAGRHPDGWLKHHGKIFQ